MFIKTLVLASLASLALAADTTCAANSPGTGPSITPDTAAAFTASSELSALSIAAQTPSCYLKAFGNETGLPIHSYLLETYTLDTYDTDSCAQYCSDTLGCTGINTYFAREPSIEPGEGCMNPASVTNIKCALYATTISYLSTQIEYEATVEEFELVVAGSNGYNYNC